MDCVLHLKGWHGTIHTYFKEIGFEESIVDLRSCNLNDGKVILLMYVDDSMLSGMNEDQIGKIFNLLKQKFESVDPGNAKFLCWHWYQA